MVNERGVVKVEALGQTFTLALGFYELSELEAALGKDISAIIADTFRVDDSDNVSVSVRGILHIVWAGLLRSDRNASLPVAASLCDALGQEETGDLVRKLLVASGIVSEDEAGNAEEAPVTKKPKPQVQAGSDAS